MTNAILEKLKQKKAEVEGRNRQRVSKPAPGRSRYRLLPPKNEHDDPYHDFGQHFIKRVPAKIGEQGELLATYVCLAKTLKKPCPVCDALGVAIRESDSDAIMAALVEAQGAKNPRTLFNVLHISGENPNEPQVLELPSSVFTGICDIASEWGAEIFSLENGRDIIIERTGKGLATTYTVQPAANVTSVPASVMKKVIPLHEYVLQENPTTTLAAISAIEQVARKKMSRDVMTVTHTSEVRPTPLLIADSAEAIAVLEAIEDSRDETLDIPESAKVYPTTDMSEYSPRGAPDSTGDVDLDSLLASLEVAT